MVHTGGPVIRPSDQQAFKGWLRPLGLGGKPAEQREFWTVIQWLMNLSTRRDPLNIPLKPLRKWGWYS